MAKCCQFRRGVPRLIRRPGHQCLTVTGSRRTPAKDVSRDSHSKGGGRRTDCCQARDQLLIKVTPQREWPATDLFKRLPRKREAGVDADGGRLTRARSICRFIFLRKINPHVLVRGELFEGGIHDRAEMKAAELAGERA